MESNDHRSITVFLLEQYTRSRYQNGQLSEGRSNISRITLPAVSNEQLLFEIEMGIAGQNYWFHLKFGPNSCEENLLYYHMYTQVR